MFTRSKCCIIGIPDHQGVIHVGGRVGAAQGPEAFRKVLKRLNGKNPVRDAMHDIGNIQGLTSDLKKNHELAAEWIQAHHLKHGLSIVVGGSHDHGYSHLLGVLRALQKTRPKVRLGCINLDAHLDVRKPAPLISSGSPFYLALEAGVILPKRFIEFGIQSHCNAPELWKYVESKKVEVVPFDELRNRNPVGVFKRKLKKLSNSCDAIVISLDLDALASAYCPGVSAPQAEGFTSMEVLEMIELAGRNKKVVSLGLFELNPEHDRDDQTSRVAATAAYHFVESAVF